MKSKLIKFGLLCIALLCLSTKCTKDPEDPPTDSSYEMNAEFTINPPTGSIETEFEFDASNSFLRNNSGENVFYINDLTYRWDFDFIDEYDPDWDEENENKKVTTHKYNQSGTYNVLFELAWVHYEGHDLNTKQFMATLVVGSDNEPPVALLTITPEEGYTNLTEFIIDGSLSWDEEDGMNLHEFMWDKDGDGNYDGDFSDEPSFVKTFDEAGIYIIMLKVRDSNGDTGETEDVLVVHAMGGEPCPNLPIVEDIVGNEYNTVLIGDQCWMAKNLFTTSYNDGTPIPNVPDGDGWVGLTTGAYVWYENETTYEDKYGALYNWYAVNNPGGLCPTGWHVATHDEWTALTDFIGGTITPNGLKLNSCRQVNSPFSGDCNTTEHPRWNEHSWGHGTNDYGFSALPGGYRNYNWGGDFANIGTSSYWWTSTESPQGGAFYRSVSISGGFNNTDDHDENSGYSVRCIKND